MGVEPPAESRCRTPRRVGAKPCKAESLWSIFIQKGRNVLSDNLPACPKLTAPSPYICSKGGRPPSLPMPGSTPDSIHEHIKFTCSCQLLWKSVKRTLLSQEPVKLRTSNLADTFTRSIRTIKNFGRKGSVGITRDRPIFLVPPVISGMGKATNFKFCTDIHRIDWNKIPLKISAKVAVGVLRDSWNFSQYPARSSLL